MLLHQATKAPKSERTVPVLITRLIKQSAQGRANEQVADPSQALMDTAEFGGDRMLDQRERPRGSHRGEGSVPSAEC